MIAADPPRNAPPLGGTLASRIAADVSGSRPGPLTILLGALHGNEPMGLEAARRTIAELETRRDDLRGRVVAVVGNRFALAMGARFIDSDLNRAFRFPGMPPLLRDVGEVERRERDELLRTLRTLVAEHRGGPAIAIDLHTFSSEGPPFVVFADTLRNRRFAACWPLPRILGLVESLPGTLAEYLAEAGLVSVVVEGGRHGDPASADRLAAAVRLALVHAGHLDRASVPHWAEDLGRLADTAAGLPPVLDVRVRHAVAPEDRFVMRPGYRNFAAVETGEHVADDARGPVHLARGGRMLLPLYQPQGDDGFFVGRPISPLWLAVSALLRRARVPDLVPLLPGVRRDPERRGGVRVNRVIARFMAADVMHALGYRTTASDDRAVAMVRRSHDVTAPSAVRI